VRPRNEHHDERGPDRGVAVAAIVDGVQGAGPAELPERLCEVAVELLPVTGASVSLHCDGMPVPLGASNAQASYVTEIQATLGDGPCQSAAERCAPVQARDLTHGRDVQRWPVFAQQATAAGVRAMYSFPLGTDVVCVGTLDLYRDTPGGLTDRDLRTARLMAAAMTVALMALPREEEGDTASANDRWLSGLTADHDGVYQATGMIMAQLGVGADEALDVLRAHAFAHGRMAVDMARDVVAHRERFERDQDAT
jgi:hypothetical protein